MNLYMYLFIFSELVAYEKSGLRINFSVERLVDTPNMIVINVVANNDTSSPFTEFLFQAAVPKVSVSINCVILLKLSDKD